MSGIVTSLVVFLLSIVIGIPLGFGFLISAESALYVLDESLNYIASTFYYSIDSSTLMGISFFMFAGSLISNAGLADRIVKFSYALLGRVKGGLIIVALFATLIMSALTGSAMPCISALIPLLVPRLEKYGYQARYTTAVLCSSSFLGYLIPPSVPAMMYCLVAQQSVAAMFLATVFPGLLLVFGYATLNFFICHKYMDASVIAPEITEEGESRAKAILKATWAALPALGAPLLILVGIYGGVFTPNEAGAIGVIYCILIGFFVYRELNIKSLWAATMTTIVTLGMTALLVAGGTVFTRFLMREGAAQAFAQAVLGLFENKYLVLLTMNLFLLFLGMFIDGIPILLLAVPMLLPLVDKLDVNLVHLGAIIIVNVGLGVVTPPYASSIFVGSRLSGVPYVELVPPMMIYFLLVGIPVLLMTTYIPAISCWLPTVVLGPQYVGSW